MPTLTSHKTTPPIDEPKREIGCAAWVALMGALMAAALSIVFHFKHKACMLQHPNVPSWTCWINP